MRTCHLAVAAGLSAAGAGGTARATTLDSAIETALATSPGLASARATYSSSAARVGVAAARGRFQVTFSSRATHDFGDDPYTPPVRDETSLLLTVPLYSGGRIRNTVVAEKLRASAAAYDLAAQADDLRISVADTYDRLLDSEDIVHLQEEEVDSLDRHLTMIGNERRMGFATRTDQAQGEARLALARAGYDAAVGRREEARVSYRQVVGADPDTLSTPATPAVSTNLQQLTEDALSYSPRLKGFRERIDAASRDVEASRGLGRPTLSFSASASYGNTDMQLAESRRFSNRLFARVGLTFSVPLYRGGQVAAQTARAAAFLDQSEADAESERRRLIAEVRTSYHAYQGALNRVAAADEARDAAQRALTGVHIEHEAGTRSAIDVLNAQRELSEGARAAARARREAHLNAMALLVRTGCYLESKIVRLAPAPTLATAAVQIDKRPASLAKLDFDLAWLPGSVASPPDAKLDRTSGRPPSSLDRLG